MKKLSIFVSGNGTNLQRIAEYFSDNKNVEISNVVCNNPKAYSIERAKNLNIPLRMITKQDFNSEAFVKELQDLGMKIKGAKKGPDSIAFGMKWLQDRAKIYIDKRRCPNTYREFVSYEYEQNRLGQFISAYPDVNNHSIDACRYALDSVMERDKIIAKRINY